ncbi:DUF4382 domain-containing protein [Thiomicrorhabdus heinhorstiae]|uniref:DUF4382 domain-containing protein n=1 Tax=Thiomicrorhabdus heinhorstiae TaxID=2748010 RepID=A0ABS0BUW7_9GAMM|nr:DUF4382 domain-containing protein [Thiomicrorhabdus heinhorstiae]MBF6057565.1 DUF4382 domain-containing protein [Thiomicrorhabdus heinhorstiae]
MKLQAKKALFATLFGTFALQGCDLSTIDSTGGDTGQMTLLVSDAPVDDAANIWVQVSGVQLKLSDGTWEKVTFTSPAELDILTLQGINFVSLLSNYTLPVGTYKEIRLLVDTGAGTKTSIVFKDGTDYPLTIPSGSEGGLTLKGNFVVKKNTTSTFMIDFDLRKSVQEAGTDTYVLKPDLNIFSMDSVGRIVGVVDNEYVRATTCSDGNSTTYNSAYLFSGAAATASDISGAATDPVETALVKRSDSTGDFEYDFGYLPAGDYTLAFTCRSDVDDVTAAGEDMQFTVINNVTVIKDTTTTVNFVW